MSNVQRKKEALSRYKTLRKVCEQLYDMRNNATLFINEHDRNTVYQFALFSAAIDNAYNAAEKALSANTELMVKIAEEEVL